MSLSSLRGPAIAKPGTACSSPVSLNDLYATCAELLSEKIADSIAEDSVSMLAELRGDTATSERLLVHQSFPGDLAIRVGDWKLSYLTRPRKTALINLRDDVGEENNLIKENSDKATELKTIFAKVIRQGRTTPGPPMKNEGPQVWEQIRWIEDVK